MLLAKFFFLNLCLLSYGFSASPFPVKGCNYPQINKITPNIPKTARTIKYNNPDAGDMAPHRIAPIHKSEPINLPILINLNLNSYAYSLMGFQLSPS